MPFGNQWLFLVSFAFCRKFYSLTVILVFLFFSYAEGRRSHRSWGRMAGLCQFYWRTCYPPFASIAKGEVFVLLYVFFVCLFGQRFLSNPRADSRHILHAGVAWARTCLLPLWGLAAPGGRKKRQIKFSLLWESMGNFCHFGGFWAISQQRVHGSTPNIICVTSEKTVICTSLIAVFLKHAWYLLPAIR